MPPRQLVASFAALFILVALCLAAACGGGDDNNNPGTGQLTDPNNVPTATPWQNAPDVIVLDPDNIQPLPPNEPNTGPVATPVAGEPGVCGLTYTVEAGDTTFGIADKCGLDPQAVIDANPDIDAGNLSVGQVIALPPAPTDAPVATDAGQ